MKGLANRSDGFQRRHHGEDWGGHVLPNIFQDRFFSSSKSAEKYLGGGGTMLAHEKNEKKITLSVTFC